MPIIKAAERTGFGDAAVPEIIGSSGDPPKNALVAPDTPAIMLVTSKIL